MIDMHATESQFVDHLAPIWLALPTRLRGAFIVPRQLTAHAAKRGVAANPQNISPANPVLVASHGDVKRVRRMGRKRIAFIEHGIGQSYAGDPETADIGSYAGGRDRDDVSLFLVPNETSADRWRDAYPHARTEIVGCPKLDTLPEYEPTNEPIVCVSFHWDCLASPETRSTFNDYRGVLPSLAERFRVIGHAHPRAFDQLERRYIRMGIEPVRDFAQVVRRAAVYVCDNSSSMYEFASTGRPVVVLNGPGYRRNVHHGLRFWEASEVGINVDEPAALSDAVALALADPPELRAGRENALRIVYDRRTGAAERAAEVVMEWAGVREAVAA